MIRGLNRTPPIAVAVLLATISLVVFIAGQSHLLTLLTALLVSFISAQGILLLQSSRATRSFPQAVEQILTMSQDEQLAEIHAQLVNSLQRISQTKDTIFRAQALKQLERITQQTDSLAEGRIEFTSTERWRVVYEELLRSPGLHLYRSVAFIESERYWQEGPGQQSTRLNLELQDTRTVRIERTAIIADHLWPELSLFPCEPIHSWLEEQHRHGIWLRLVRESQLASEADLVGDFGIYGTRAVGTQTSDPEGRTLKFTLDFDFELVKRAEERWDRLAVYCISYCDLLDRQH